MNFYDALTWIYWVMLLYFVALVMLNLFEAEGLLRKMLGAAIMVPFILRLFGIA